MDFCGSWGPAFELDAPHVGADAQLDRGGAARARRLYQQLANKHCRSLDLALRRFQLAYTRRLPDDAVVDFAIALEASLSQGKTTGITKELQLRAAMLIGKDIPDIYRRVQSLYKVRGKLVHHGLDLKLALTGVNNRVKPDSYRVQVQNDVRAILAHYVGMCVRHGKGVDELNRMLDGQVMARITSGK